MRVNFTELLPSIRRDDIGAMRGSNGATTKASYNFESQVDALYQVVDQLSGKMSDAFSECRLAPIRERTVWDGRCWALLSSRLISTGDGTQRRPGR